MRQAEKQRPPLREASSFYPFMSRVINLSYGVSTKSSRLVPTDNNWCRTTALIHWKKMVKSKELKVMRKKIEKADKLPNPLAIMQNVPEDLPFTLPTRPSASDASKTLELQALSSAQLPEDVPTRLLQLFEDNMGDLYRVSTWGLNLQEKAAEFSHRKARFLILWSKQQSEEEGRQLAAFVHYRFCFDDDERPDWAVLYVFELQVAEGFKRKQLGQKLQLLLEEIGRVTQMTKIMLTVFNSNVAAIKFYRDRCGYVVDETDPMNYNERADYMILSKTL